MIDERLCSPCLRQRVAAITGGAGDLGAALVLGLAQAGVSTALLDLDEAKAQRRATEVTAQTGTPCIGLRCDVLDEASLAGVRAKLEAALGPLDFLINAAGGNSSRATTTAETVQSEPGDFSGTFFDLDLAAFRSCLDLNLLGTVIPTKVLGRRLVERRTGVIINFSSMNAFRPLTRIPAYAAGKSAVTNFTQWLAVHLAPAQVRVNAIAPGFFLTEQLKYLAFDATGALTPRYRNVLAHTPMNRLGRPEELVGTLLFLLSEQSRFVTGVTIPVDGGFSAYSGV